METPKGRNDTGSSRPPFRHARRCPPHLAVLRRPGFVRAAPALPGTTRIRLPSASPPCCDRTEAKVSHLHSNNSASRRSLEAVEKVLTGRDLARDLARVRLRLIVDTARKGSSEARHGGRRIRASPRPAKLRPGLDVVRPRAARCGRSTLTPTTAPALTGTSPGTPGWSA